MMIHVNTTQSKRTKRGKRHHPRVICTRCMKPAVRYYVIQKLGGEMVRKIVYEHRDEPPVKEFIFRENKRFRYRRCYTGVIQDGLPFIKEEEEKKPESESELDYKKIFEDNIRELSEIAFDISGEEAKRILKNLQRYLETKRHEMSK